MKKMKLSTLLNKIKQKGAKTKPDEAVNKAPKADRDQPTVIEPVNLQKDIGAYYKQARGWQYDVFDSVVKSRNRYRSAFMWAAGFLVLSVLVISSMLPMREIVPVVIHRDLSGDSYVTTVSGHFKFKHTPAQIKSEVYHFVKRFEGYSITGFTLANQYVKSQSSPHVFDLYVKHISGAGYLKKLGRKGYRQVTIEYIQLVNSKENKGQLHSTNEAIITYSITDKLYSGQILDHRKWQTIVNWKYKGLPPSQAQQFMNFDGFTVTGYQSTPLNYQGKSNA